MTKSYQLKKERMDITSFAIRRTSGYLMLALIFLFLSACLPGNNFSIIQKELAKQNVQIDGKRDVMLILYNKSECANCNITMGSVYNYQPLLQLIPGSNKCVLMSPVREIEKRSYNDQFSFLQPNPPKIYNEQLYSKLQAELGAAGYEGGIFILSPAGKVLFKSKMKNAHILDEINVYIEKHDKD